MSNNFGLIAYHMKISQNSFYLCSSSRRQSMFLDIPAYQHSTMVLLIYGCMQRADPLCSKGKKKIKIFCKNIFRGLAHSVRESVDLLLGHWIGALTSPSHLLFYVFSHHMTDCPVTYINKFYLWYLRIPCNLFHIII